MVIMRFTITRSNGQFREEVYGGKFRPRVSSREFKSDFHLAPRSFVIKKFPPCRGGEYLN